MREIKFRAWNGTEMVGKFGAFYVNPGEEGNGLDPRDSSSLSYFNTIYSESTPIMQFTGLKDKNGKDIYEGDIIELRRFNLKSQYEVKWDDTYACFFGIHAKREGDEFGVYTHKLGLNESFFVIGNIYENPELLKA